jgi:hypothetical protein
MKKIIVFMMLLVLSAASFSQPTTNPATTAKTDYLQKSKNQKKTAWIMLGGGASFILLGDLIGNSKSSSFGDAGTGFVVAGIGALSMLGSIPLFIASTKNKKKANNASTLLLKMEAIPAIQRQSFTQYSYPAISLKISL